MEDNKSKYEENQELIKKIKQKYNLESDEQLIFFLIDKLAQRGG